MAPLKVNLVKSETPSTHFYKSNTSTLNNNSMHNVDLVKSMPATDVKAYYENPIRMASAMDYKDKPTSLSYNILYQMSVKNSVISAVLTTRVNQVSTFTKPARFSTDGIGYQVRLRDPQSVPTKEQQEVMNAIELFLENCGFDDSSDRDDFDTFIRKLVRDSLTYDQMCFEIVPDRKGRPAELYAVDASTIRAASENYEGKTGWTERVPKKNEEVKWVQVVDGTVVSWFTASELAFGVRNPRSNINLQPYGFSELEMLIQQITSHLYAEEYNSKYFSQGGTTKGIINIKSDPNGIGNKEQLDSFKRQWRAQVNGMTGSWKTPVLQVPEGIEYINVNQSNRDMEYSQWVNYLINIVCAVYAIDPAEINFANNGGAAGQSSVFESSQEQKLKNSKDKGLKPLLRFIESILNKYVISKFSQDYVFAFTGLDEKSEAEKADLETKQVKVWRTVNEIRKERGEKPIENGDVILDPSWLNYVQQKEQAAAMGGMGDMGEDDGSYEDSSYGEGNEDEEPNSNEGEVESSDSEESVETSQGNNSSQEKPSNDEENQSEPDSYSDYESEPETADYSDYDTSEEKDDYSDYPTSEEKDDYSDYQTEKTEKSLTRLIITLED